MKTELENSQEDLNFSQLCVKNLQASLAVINSEKPSTKETSSQSSSTSQQTEQDTLKEQEMCDVKLTSDLSNPKECNDCKEYQNQITKLNERVEIMDKELQKLRSILIQEVFSNSLFGFMSSKKMQRNNRTSTTCKHECRDNFSLPISPPFEEELL